MCATRNNIRLLIIIITLIIIILITWLELTRKICDSAIFGFHSGPVSPWVSKTLASTAAGNFTEYCKIAHEEM